MTYVKTCGLTRREDVERAVELGASALGFILVPGRTLGTIKAFSVETGKDLEKTGRYCHAGLFLLDSRKKTLILGNPFDHSLLAGKIFARPFLLAGGLCPENLPLALETVRPFGVDLNSGVESAPGMKDRDRMAAALAAVKQFDRSERRDRQ